MNRPHAPAPTGRIALVAGATGLVGSEILKALLADANVATVYALVRRPLPLHHPKLTSQVVEFAALPDLPDVDETYLALGTTIKVAGSEEAFRAVDYDANLAVAQGVLAAGCKRLGIVSAMGSDAQSRVFYNRVKGELEEALAKMRFATVVVARPSLLVGDRQALGQPERGGEKLGLAATRWIRPLIPRNYRPIRAADVAAALLRTVPVVRGKQVLLSGEMQP
jgi:uncharacterized protein YbjT (DUF2867 family)